MIEEVLSPEFLRGRAQQLKGKPVRPPLPRPLDGFRLSRNKAAPFIPSDEGQSLLQSALEEGIEADPTLHAAPATTDDPCGTHRPADAAPRAANETLGGRFGPNDFGWLQTKLAELTSERVASSDKPVTAELASDARVLLVSDWGTGLRGAQLVGEQMREKVKEAVAQGREVHVVHLGDVYYCGTLREYKRYFLDMWPVRVADGFDGVHSWNLNGNHDMYSGGHGYFGLIAGNLEGDDRGSLFEQQGGCSYFKLANEHWRIYGLDSAYDDDQHLGDAQLRWLQDELRSDGGQAMLLSHHQLDSVYDRGRVNGVLLKELGPDLDAGRVRAWYWGHEHRCIRYDPFRRIQYPRCIGNGGVPEVVEATFFSIIKRIVGLIAGLFKHARGGRPPKIRDNYQVAWPADGVHWRRHGFVCLDLDGAAINASYIDQCGGEAFPAERLT